MRFPVTAIVLLWAGCAHLPFGHDANVRQEDVAAARRWRSAIPVCDAAAPESPVTLTGKLLHLRSICTEMACPSSSCCNGCSFQLGLEQPTGPVPLAGKDDSDGYWLGGHDCSMSDVADEVGHPDVRVWGELKERPYGQVAQLVVAGLCVVR